MRWKQPEGPQGKVMTNAKQPSKPEAQAAQGKSDMPVDLPGTVPGRALSCEEIKRQQNDLLDSHFHKKVNTLTCRCSGCQSDGTLPVIASAADAPLLNTAYDGSGGFLPVGATDFHWEVGVGNASGPSSVPTTGWLPASVYIGSGNWAASPFANANWLGSDDPNYVHVYYRYRFNLASSVNLATFVLNLDFYADDIVQEIYINGAPQSPGHGNLPGGGFLPTAKAQIALDNSWKRCDNELIFHVWSMGGAPAGLLVQNTIKGDPQSTGCNCDCTCHPAEFPALQPCITVKWGDSKCDCLESDDVEVLSIAVCNCYSNLSFDCFSIGQILITDLAGNPVANLPDGTPSIEVLPSGPICFGDIGPCVSKEKPSCVTREFVVHTRGALAKDYRITLRGICFEVCHHYQQERCFNLTVCADR